MLMRMIPRSTAMQIDLFPSELDEDNPPQEISPRTIALLARLLREHAERSPRVTAGRMEVVNE
jgi:hypothetical protein